MKYFCPYCNSKYQFKSNSNKGKLLCGLCGEEMIKKSFINLKQIISLIIVTTFIFPLFYTFVISIINRKQIKKDIYQGFNTELKQFEFNKDRESSST
tara:strand:- start:89 stop:379 length:291 start_codon:yes stop_codon:yes gene_type:complete